MLKREKQYIGCSYCQGVGGQGLNVPGAGTNDLPIPSPRISGQHGWYLVQQLKNFKNGIRGKHEKDIGGKVMRVETLSLYKDEMIVNVVTYINSLK